MLDSAGESNQHQVTLSQVNASYVIKVNVRQTYDIRAITI